MASELKSKMLHGMAWNAVGNMSGKVINFLITIVLARLLSPSDFGLMAMLAIFIGISEVFVDSGITSALVRKPDIKEEDYSTAFYYNIIIGVVCYLVLFLIAPLIAGFYNKPILSSLLRVQSICILVQALMLVQNTRLIRKMDFKRTSIIQLTTNILSGIVAIVAAFYGLGVWSLVIKNVFCAVIRVPVYWYVYAWKPQWTFSKESFHYIFDYGSKLLATGLINTFFANINSIVIGKFFSAKSLGYYTKANDMAALPSGNIMGILQSVTFPALSEIQNDKERICDVYRRLIRLSCFVVFPLMIGLAAVAKPLIILLYTAKWAPCIIYLQVVCFALLWNPLFSLNLNLLEVKGRSDLTLKVQTTVKFLSFGITIAAIPFGVLGICVGSVIAAFLSLFVTTYYTGKLIGVGYWAQMKDVFPIFFNSLLMGGVSFLMVTIISNLWLSLLVGVVVGGLYYLATSYFTRSAELKEIINIIKRK